MERGFDLSPGAVAGDGTEATGIVAVPAGVAGGTVGGTDPADAGALGAEKAEKGDPPPGAEAVAEGGAPAGCTGVVGIIADGSPDVDVVGECAGATEGAVAADPDPDPDDVRPDTKCSARTRTMDRR